MGHWNGPRFPSSKDIWQSYDVSNPPPKSTTMAFDWWQAYKDYWSSHDWSNIRPDLFNICRLACQQLCDFSRRPDCYTVPAWWMKDISGVREKVGIILPLVWLAALNIGWRYINPVSKLIIIGSDNGLSPDRRQAIISTNAGILLIGPLGTNFREILIEIHTFSFKKMRLKMSFGKWRPFCLALNVLRQECDLPHIVQEDWEIVYQEVLSL